MNNIMVISRYNEDISWLDSYTNFIKIVYNKGDVIAGNFFCVGKENIGGNQRDILDFIIENYFTFEDKKVAFVQGFPFDHCNKEHLNELLQRDYFTSLEYYPEIKSGWERRSEDGGYIEINNSWYIEDVNKKFSVSCRYESFDSFMQTYFDNYTHLDWIRFAPGSQYIIMDKEVKRYSLDFWKSLYNELNSKFCAEGHIIERAMWHIFNGTYNARF